MPRRVKIVVLQLADDFERTGRALGGRMLVFEVLLVLSHELLRFSWLENYSPE